MASSMYSAHASATCDSQCYVHWKHNVICAAGASVHDLSDSDNVRLLLWYRSGEPVWMAADSLRMLVAGAALAKREVAKERILKRMFAFGGEGEKV